MMRPTARPLRLLAALLLTGCAVAPPADRSVFKTITDAAGGEAPAAASTAPAQIPPGLLPPISVEIPAADTKAEERFDLAVNAIAPAQLFGALAEETGYNIIVHPEVKQPVTLKLKQATMSEILDAIRTIYGFEYRIDRRIVYISTASMQTRLFRVEYLTSQRRGSTDMRVSANTVSQQASVTQQVVQQQIAQAAAQGPGASTQSVQVQTTTRSDIWGEIREAVSVLAGCAIRGADIACEGGRMVVLSPQAGTVLVRAMPAELKSIDEYLRASELSQGKQVLIEARILEVALRDGYESGVNWSMFGGGGLGFGQLTPGTQMRSSRTGQALTGGVPPGGTISTPLDAGIVTGATPIPLSAAAGRALTSGVGAAGSMFALAFQGASFAALMSFIETQGTVHTLSSPRISTLNNQKAVLKVGSDALYVTRITGGSITPGIAGAAPTVSSPTFELQSFFSGIALDVTPRIHDDGNITLHVRPAVSAVAQQLSTFNLGTLGSYTIPLVSNQVSETDSVIRTRDSQIVAIGGLMRQALNETRSGLPGIGAALNGLLDSANRVTEKRELVLLLKTTIVDTGEVWNRNVRDARERIQALDPALRPSAQPQR